MRDTKERILLTALELFSTSGYAAVSMRDIADALGITKGALYRHYRDKRDILDSILRRMEERDAAEAGAYGLPTGTPREMGETYAGAAAEEITAYAKAMFRYWTGDAFASRFRRLLSLEQYRSGEMGRLWQQYLAAGPMGYLADLFAAMGAPDPLEEAAAFYGTMFLYYSVYDGAEDPRAVLEIVDRLLDRAGEQLKEAIKR